MDQESSARRVIERSTESAESQTFFQFGRGKRVLESTGGIPKRRHQIYTGRSCLKIGKVSHYR
jgi:hypothetical protein